MWRGLGACLGFLSRRGASFRMVAVGIQPTVAGAVPARRGATLEDACQTVFKRRSATRRCWNHATPVSWQTWRAKGPKICQPRATPWVFPETNPSPERATQFCPALSGLDPIFLAYPGRCLGLACLRTAGAPAARTALSQNRISMVGTRNPRAEAHGYRRRLAPRETRPVVDDAQNGRCARPRDGGARSQLSRSVAHA